MKYHKNIPLLLLAVAFLMSVPTVQASKRSADAAGLFGAADLSQDPGQASKRLTIAKQREICEICLEDMLDPREISSLYRIQPTWNYCPHRFHTECISNYLERDNHCPSCKIQVLYTMIADNQHIDGEGIPNNPSMADLLEITEDLNAPVNDDQTLLGAACAAGCIEDVLEFLSDERVSTNPGLYLNTPSSFFGYNNMPPLHWAAGSGHFAIAKILLEHGASVNTQIDIDDKNKIFAGATALYMASDLAIVKLLLEYDADPYQFSANGFTVLHPASGNTDPRILQLMLEIVPQLVNQAEAQDGLTPLHVASGNGHVPNVTLLLDCGANINAALTANFIEHNRNFDSYTPLHVAAENNRLAVVQILVQRGANIYARTSENKTARDLAIQENHNDIADFLAQAEASALPSALPAAP